MRSRSSGSWAFRPALRCAALAACLVAGPLHSGGKFFLPRDVVNVRTAYGAKGDGRNDDTEALRNAIRENIRRDVYVLLPAGRYLVSGSLEWKDKAGQWQNGLTLIGEDREKTVISLRDSCSGFDDTLNPRGMIVTASGPGPACNPANGAGNNAFRNYLRNLSLETGKGNPAAIGIDFIANNNGGVMQVTVASGDGKGRAGLSMHRRWPGPALFKDVSVRGFDFGIRVEGIDCGLTFENISLSGQRIAGLWNRDNVLCIRGLRSDNAVPALRNEGEGMVVLVDAALTGGAPAAAAVVNEACLFARDLKTVGYGTALISKGTGLPGGAVPEFVSDSPRGLFTPARKSLRLPIEETPAYWDSDSSHWANALDFGCLPGDDRDDGPCLEKALASGKSTLYLPPGRYDCDRTLVLGPSLRHLLGNGASLVPGPSFADAKRPKTLLRVVGKGSLLTLENLTLSHWNSSHPGALLLEHASPRDLALKSLLMWDDCISLAYRGGPDAGKLFLEDVSNQGNATGWEFAPGQRIWARQFNVEGKRRKILNQGASLWILGIKTEKAATVIETRAGGKTELLGGLLYPTDVDTTGEIPAFINDGSSVSLSYAHTAYRTQSAYRIHVREKQGSAVRSLGSDSLPRRTRGAFMGLYVGHPP